MKKRNLKILLLIAIAAVAVLNPFRRLTAQAATIRADVNVNIRAGASAAAEKIGQAEKGRTLDLIGSDNGWFQVLWNGQLGYTAMNYWSGNTVTSTGRVNVRQAADPYAPVLGQVTAGSEVIVLGRSGDWLNIEFQGVSAFTHRSYWDISDIFFERLPYIVSEMTQESLPPLPDPTQEPALESAGDNYRIISETPGYETSKDAVARENSVSALPSGTYFVLRTARGMYEISKDVNSPGVWINPAQNTGRKIIPGSAESPVIPPLPIPDADKEWSAGERFVLHEALAGYKDSAGAIAKTDSTIMLPAGEYIVFKTHNSMVNISTSRTVPGAWIDPAENRPPATATSQAPSPQTPPPEAAAHTTLGDKVVEEAQKLLGAPYIYGAESWTEGGFDCSGLTQFVYGQVGIDIPRTASYQWAGISRKVTNPRPGDIIAFAKAEEGGVYHVGIYIGDNKMIHAPKPGAQVKISSLNWYYRNGWVQGYLRPYSD